MTVWAEITATRSIATGTPTIITSTFALGELLLSNLLFYLSNNLA